MIDAYQSWNFFTGSWISLQYCKFISLTCLSFFILVSLESRSDVVQLFKFMSTEVQVSKSVLVTDLTVVIPRIRVGHIPPVVLSNHPSVPPYSTAKLLKYGYDLVWWKNGLNSEMYQGTLTSANNDLGTYCGLKMWKPASSVTFCRYLPNLLYIIYALMCSISLLWLLVFSISRYIESWISVWMKKMVCHGDWTRRLIFW